MSPWLLALALLALCAVLLVARAIGLQVLGERTARLSSHGTAWRSRL